MGNEDDKKKEDSFEEPANTDPLSVDTQLRILIQKFDMMESSFNSLKQAVVSTQIQIGKVVSDVDMLKRKQSGRLFDFHTNSLSNTSTVQNTDNTTTNSNANASAIPSIPISNTHTQQASHSQTHQSRSTYDHGSILPPIYNASVMTPQQFLQEAEEYFIIRNVPEDEWVKLVFRLFKPESHTACWWREVKEDVTDWDNFKSYFRIYEMTLTNEDAMAQELFNRKQKLNESFEGFAWDVVKMYKKVYPSASKEQIAERIINGCFSEIAVLLRRNTYNGIPELIYEAREIIRDLNKNRSFEKKILFRARETDPISNVETKSYNQQQSKSYYRNNSNRSIQKLQANSNFNALEEKAESTLASSSNDTPNSEPPKAQKNGKYCKYCKKNGHVISECRKKLWRDQNPRNQNRSSTASSNNNANSEN